jgi:hypothetical protein
VPDEPNPYAPPRDTGQREPPAPAGEPTERFSLGQPGRVRWTLSFYPGVLHLQPSDGKPARALDHRDFVENATLNLWSAAGQLLVKSPPPVVAVALSAEALAALRAWLTPILQEHLSRALRAQRATAIVLGVLWILPAGSAPRASAIIFGVTWLAWAAWVTFKPHRALLLASAALWTVAGILVARNAVHGSKLWILPLVFFVPAVLARLRAYRFYAPLPSAP